MMSKVGCGQRKYSNYRLAGRNQNKGARSLRKTHNDDVTPWDFVIEVLRTVFELPQQKAESVTSLAHTRGSAPVAMFAKEEAKHRVGKAHGMARAADYPLKFTIESE